MPRQFVQAWHAQEARCKQLQGQLERLETRLQLERDRQEGAAPVRARLTKTPQPPQPSQLERMSVSELDELVARASAQREIQLAKAAARLQKSWRARARRSMQAPAPAPAPAPALTSTLPPTALMACLHCCSGGCWTPTRGSRWSTRSGAGWHTGCPTRASRR